MPGAISGNVIVMNTHCDAPRVRAPLKRRSTFSSESLIALTINGNAMGGGYGRTLPGKGDRPTQLVVKPPADGAIAAKITSR